MIEIRNPRLERAVALTAADRKWMDDIVNDVNANWDGEGPGKAPSMQCATPLFHWRLTKLLIEESVLRAVMII
jgi:hypothetical protein